MQSKGCCHAGDWCCQTALWLDFGGCLIGSSHPTTVLLNNDDVNFKELMMVPLCVPRVRALVEDAVTSAAVRWNLQQIYQCMLDDNFIQVFYHLSPKNRRAFSVLISPTFSSVRVGSFFCRHSVTLVRIIGKELGTLG